MRRFTFIIILFSIIIGLLPSCSQQLKKEKPITLPQGLKQVEYKEATDSYYHPYDGGIDVYNASESDLKKVSLSEYNKDFGAVPSERTAADIASIVFYEVYKDCPKKEAPFIVKYNKNAEAWIVHGTLPPNMFGGVATIGIKKETGKILMLVHTK